MIGNFRKNSGVAMLPLVLLIGGLITVIAITITLTSSLSSHSSAAIKWSSEALAGAQAGVDDGIIKIIRNNSHSGTSTLAIGNANVTVSIDSNAPISGKGTIISCGVVRSSQRKLQAIVNIDAITGQVNIESIQEIAIGESCPEASVILATVPSVPQSLTPTAGNTQITLGWSAPSSNGGASITSYKVYRGTTSNGETLLSSGGCSSLGNVLTCTDTNLTNGTPYYYKVSAVNSVGEGSQSSEVNATPSVPPGLIEITLNWTKNLADVSFRDSNPFWTNHDSQIMWDISSLPSGITIESAKIYLYQDNSGGSMGQYQCWYINDQTWTEATDVNTFLNQSLLNETTLVDVDIIENSIVDVKTQLQASIANGNTKFTVRFGHGIDFGFVYDELLTIGNKLTGWLEFNDREDTYGFGDETKPYLVITYSL